MIDLYVLYTIIGCWLLALSGVAVAAGLAFWFMGNPRFLTNQIKKLVLANNIDRAIKVCNSQGTSLLAQKTKALLCAANRPYRLELAFQDGSAFFASKKLAPASWVRVLVGGAGSLTLLIGFLISTEGTFVLYCLSAVLLVSWGLSAWMLGKVGVRMMESDACLRDIRDTLYLRSQTNNSINYLPPTIRPRKDYSREELAAWELSMSAFEERMAGRRETDKDFSIEEAYDTEADADGVLPSI